jgi:hypothetical protein
MTLIHPRRIAVMAVLASAAGFTACGGSSNTTAPVVTNYSLNKIDGFALPHQVDQSTDGTVTFVMTDMVLSVADVGTWHSSGHRTATNNGVASVQDLENGGHYTVQGASITFLTNNADVAWTGTSTDNSYTLSDALHVYLFVKQ